MNQMVHMNYGTLFAALPAPETAKRAGSAGSFRDLAAQLCAPTAEIRSEMSLDAYKRAVWEKIEQLPMSASHRMMSASVQITDEGFAAMRDDPDYEAWVLDQLRQAFAFENPWVSVCGGGYAVYSFGASKADYRGDSWYPGFQNGQGAAVFEERAKGGFWERRAESQKKYMELQLKAAAQRRLWMKLRMNGGSLSAAELLSGLL